MPGLISECETHFHTTNLYDILGVKNSATPSKLRKAFYKMSLLHHPDRREGALKTEATIHFQILSKIYSILSDEEKRKIYDESGEVDEDDNVTSKTYEDWVGYWRLLFPRVTTKQIEEYCSEYKDSSKELDDLMEIYERCQGDMDVIMETLLFTSHADETRIRGLIDKLIGEGRVQSYPAYTHEDARKAANRAKRAAKEERMYKQSEKKKKSESDMGGEGSLVSAILANRERHLKSTENLLDRLTDKYCQPPTKNKKKAKSSK